MTRTTIDNSDFLISTVEPARFSSQINDFTPDCMAVAKVARAVQQVVQQRLTHVVLAK